MHVNRKLSVKDACFDTQPTQQNIPDLKCLRACSPIIFDIYRPPKSGLPSIIWCVPIPRQRNKSAILARIKHSISVGWKKESKNKKKKGERGGILGPLTHFTYCHIWPYIVTYCNVWQCMVTYGIPYFPMISI